MTTKQISGMGEVIVFQTWTYKGQGFRISKIDGGKISFKAANPEKWKAKIGPKTEGTIDIDFLTQKCQLVMQNKWGSGGLNRQDFLDYYLKCKKLNWSDSKIGKFIGVACSTVAHYKNGSPPRKSIQILIVKAINKHEEFFNENHDSVILPRNEEKIINEAGWGSGGLSREMFMKVCERWNLSDAQLAARLGIKLSALISYRVGSYTPRKKTQIKILKAIEEYSIEVKPIEVKPVGVTSLVVAAIEAFKPEVLKINKQIEYVKTQNNEHRRNFNNTMKLLHNKLKYREEQTEELTEEVKQQVLLSKQLTEQVGQLQSMIEKLLISLGENVGVNHS